MEFPQRMSMWVFCFVGIWNSTFIVFNMISNQFRYTSFMIGLSLPLVAVVGVVAGVLVFTLLHFRRPRWRRRHRFYQHISICVLKIFSLCSFMHLARSTFFRCVSFSLPLASYMLSLSIGLSVCLGFSAHGTWPMITSITLIIHLFITGKVASAWVRVVCRVPAVVAVVVAAAAFLFSHHC